ncbi:FxLYD domain-containing protein [Streptomyces sp. NPDC057445]|uniref:FxLYD domain-containing protein n=1 Tax=Streptomyces sp. NPDC057445 TaxID=3346136 RepID=UPI0036AFC319
MLIATFGVLGGLALLLILGIALLGAVVGKSGSAGAGGGSGSARSGAGTAAEPADRGHVEDVEITGCEVDDVTGWPSAELTITNKSSKASNYWVNVEFVTSTGTRVEDGFAATSHLAPGQKAEKKVQALTKVPENVNCKVTKVTRFAS